MCISYHPSQYAYSGDNTWLADASYDASNTNGKGRQVPRRGEEKGASWSNDFG